MPNEMPIEKFAKLKKSGANVPVKPEDVVALNIAIGLLDCMGFDVPDEVREKAVKNLSLLGGDNEQDVGRFQFNEQDLEIFDALNRVLGDK